MKTAQTIVLVLHVLGATVWTGGHLLLAIRILPGALRRRDTRPILEFERAFEPIGLPSLALQVFTGLWLAYALMPDTSEWFAFDRPASHLLVTKLALLAATVALAAHARLRLIPTLDEQRLKPLAWHIVAVTVIAVLFVTAGVVFRADA